ncbi:hypothetical protein SAMN05421688_2959 [Poseidonocella pacifica]|uniref:DUF3618 domain-containing protein n=1 Tax=Poseidonocella pacifica TaxID=871651 RepID=A0A1I0YGL0_9RHOB|nr:hypothetical protein [Poseidonocella pacifica]SFB11303.1 hypothetical protein SAMN05421688_2959 [Poseidonocella pacifica]
MSDKSSSRIEGQIETEREELGRALDGLSEALSSDRIAETVHQVVDKYRREIGETALSTASRNPAALAFLGAGLALLVAPTPKRSQAVTDLSQTASLQGQPSTSSATSGRNAESLRRSIDRGLEKLPPAARRRILAARQSAVHAQEELDRRGRKALAASRGAMQDQPLVVGAVALGLGALIGSLLPGTRQENAALGARRDALLRRADLMMHEELEKLQAKGEDALRDGLERSREAINRTVS